MKDLKNIFKIELLQYELADFICIPCAFLIIFLLHKILPVDYPVGHEDLGLVIRLYISFIVVFGNVLYNEGIALKGPINIKYAKSVGLSSLLVTVVGIYWLTYILQAIVV